MTFGTLKSLAMAFCDGFLRVSFKIGKTLDRVDSLDTNVKTLPDNSLKTLPGEGLAEKLEQLKTWLLENKDANGIVDAEALTVKIRQLGLDLSKAIKLLKDDCVISEAPHIGKWLVVKC